MKYFHRTTVAPDDVLARAAEFLGARLSPAEESPRRRRFAGAIGQITVTVEAEGGHYTRVTVETNQVGESEADKLAKRFLTLVHTLAEPSHAPRGAY
ncbi:MAG TPA: hypothetical protein VFK09_06405 [Gemmatimonadales bacterium]|jgi:hypothetical protein|nr:hypothetical protein [Gemmatimonadales bacterium]